MVFSKWRFPVGCGVKLGFDFHKGDQGLDGVFVNS